MADCCLLPVSCWFLAQFFLRPWTWRRHATYFKLYSCLDYFSTLKIEAKYFSDIIFALTGLHGVISQKIKFFITAAVRISKPTEFLTYFVYLQSWASSRVPRHYLNGLFVITSQFLQPVSLRSRLFLRLYFFLSVLPSSTRRFSFRYRLLLNSIRFMCKLLVA
jgi:hypothetical protein